MIRTTALFCTHPPEVLKLRYKQQGII
ncbi:hypothetical protein BC936DRAFT_137000 [Jimgerdemannia flammicorona]|uniref:Uncharacterized protein n=1 Tax=Jimgerdemannia flammicorona TaxID=994334 RepID=A0A433CYA4_9FUNG|nr:hypothetical protein BC936DRAFT_137000 [Jimgerdemannia flammicorona]